jgi:membrane associated rhomboid family serine protease
LLGGEAVELDLPAPGAPPLVAFAVYGPAEIGRTLVLLPFGTADPVGFRPWQLITGPLLYPPSGGFPALMLGFLGFIFFAAPVERMLGVRSFFQLWLVASLSGAVLGLLLSAILPSPVAFGFAPAVFSVMVVHCMMTPEASVPFHLIFTVVHVRMKWIAATIAGLVLLRTLGLMGGGPSGAYSLAGMIGGYLWWRSGADLDPRRMRLRRRARANLRLAVDRATQGPDEQTFH